MYVIVSMIIFQIYESNYIILSHISFVKSWITPTLLNICEVLHIIFHFSMKMIDKKLFMCLAVLQSYNPNE